MISRDLIYDLYINKNLTRQEVADRLGISKNALIYILGKLNIIKLNACKIRDKYNNRDWLFKKYIIEKNMD